MSTSTPTRLNVLDFHNSAAHGRDMTPAAIAALEKAKTLDNSSIFFPPGEYHFWPEHAVERTYYVSNNDYGPRRIIFPLIGVKNLMIDGGGAAFILHGRVSPFVVDHSSNVTIRCLSIDCERPFHTEGRIVAATPESVDLMIDRTMFPYRVREDGELVFFGEGWECDDDAVLGLTEFDPRTGGPSYDVRFYLAKFRRHKKIFNDKMLDEGTRPVYASELPSGALRIHGQFEAVFRVGNVLAIAHEKRTNAAVFITESHNVHLEAIDIFHVGSMGVIGQLSSDISLYGVNTRPKPGSGRLISTVADATHFVNCFGKLSMERCIFEGMMDDGGNVHGIVTLISQILAPDRIEVELKHGQQKGINVYAPGDTIHFLNRKTLGTHHKAVVRSSELTDPGHIVVTLDSSVEGFVQVGTAVENPTRMPELHIRGCRAGHNRPRGFLVSTSKRAVIEDCTFYSCAVGIHVSGDANYWFESGAVNDVLIRNNHFLDIGYSWRNAAVLVSPEIEEHGGCYHRNIRVENNVFENYDTLLLVAQSVDGLRFVNNRYRRTRNYPWRAEERPYVELKHCLNTVVEDPLPL